MEWVVTSDFHRITLRPRTRGHRTNAGPRLYRIDRDRGLCRDVKNAHFKSSAPVVTVVPNDLIDGNLLAMVAVLGLLTTRRRHIA